MERQLYTSSPQQSAQKRINQRSGICTQGKTWGRVYAPNVTCEEYYAETVFYKVGADALPFMFAAMLENENMTPEILDVMEDVLETKLQSYRHTAKITAING